MLDDGRIIGVVRGDVSFIKGLGRLRSSKGFRIVTGRLLQAMNRAGFIYVADGQGLVRPNGLPMRPEAGDFRKDNGNGFSPSGLDVSGLLDGNGIRENCGRVAIRRHKDFRHSGDF